MRAGPSGLWAMAASGPVGTGGELRGVLAVVTPDLSKLDASQSAREVDVLGLDRDALGVDRT